MPTQERLRARAGADQLLNLHQAAERAGYTSESLRKLMWPRGQQQPPEPPPLFKIRGRWYARAGELDAWIAERDELTA